MGLSASVVSRRLSGSAPFTVEEVAVICGEFDIPVDEIFTTCSRSTRLPMEFIQPDLLLYGEESYEIFAWPVELFSLAARSDDSTFYATCNTFPDILNPSFGWVARFWEYQRLFFYRDTLPMTALSDIVYSPAEQVLMEQYMSAVHSLKKSAYIVSDRVVENYINNMKRFYLTGRITREEAVCMALEIENVLELFEKICRNGYVEGGKEVEIYCTDMFLPGDMYVVQSDRVRFGVFYVSPLNPVVTRSVEVCDTMAGWFDFWRHSTTLISQMGTQVRRAFMDVQYKALAAFKAELGV
ncbi:MAG: hypothetical protein LUF04_12895 [Bacteroides sp.]|nr:hypothetical protein [Bacteroides sp.]